MEVNAKRGLHAHPDKETQQSTRGSRCEDCGPTSGEDQAQPDQADHQRVTLIARDDARHDATARRQLQALRELAAKRGAVKS